MALTEQEAAIVEAQEAAQQLARNARRFRRAAEALASKAVARADAVLAAKADHALAQAADAETAAESRLANVLEEMRQAKKDFQARRGSVPEGVHLLLEMSDGSVGYHFAVSCVRRGPFDPGVQYDVSDEAIAVQLDRAGSYVDAQGVKQWRDGWPLISWRRAELSEFPQNRNHRNAWAIDKGAIVVDMTKARQVQIARLKRERLDALDALDKQIAATEDKGGNAADLRAKRQRLRDMPVLLTPALEAAATPEELQTITLAALDA